MVLYFDNASFGDYSVKVLADLQNITAQLIKIGLEINGGKYELTIFNYASPDDCQLTEAIFKAVLPDIKIVPTPFYLNCVQLKVFDRTIHKTV